MEDDEAQAHGIYPEIPSARSPNRIYENKTGVYEVLGQKRPKYV